eukprot:TRINITY_DN121303_c0_g1_i1.p1 TRINITY_DN121303_c0_g1~~TRINITY_DN121303_c0_g1_i1.p1  ORF type:complete len:582 (+),score=70.33 TRINITY_DN121303_c0_g1_i1:99-1844(+)
MTRGDAVELAEAVAVAETGSARDIVLKVKDQEDPSAQPPSNPAEYADWALECAGSWGPFQRRCTAQYAVPWLVCGMQTLVHVFVTLPAHRRRHCHNQLDHCTQDPIEDQDCSVPADEYEFKDPTYLVTSEFNLVCDSAVGLPLLGTFFFLGFLVGAAYIGNLCDRLGRKRAYLCSTMLIQVAGLGVCMAPSYGFYAFCRFLTGAGVGGIGLVAFVWNAEFIGKEQRSLLAATTNGMFAIGFLLLSPLSYCLPAWRMLSFAVWLLGLPSLFIYQSLLESPKWLCSQGRLQEAHEVYCQVAERNGRELPAAPPSELSLHVSEANPATPDAAATEKESAIKQLLFDARLSRRFIIMVYTWFTLSFGYYGLSMGVSNLGWSVYAAAGLSAGVELPVYPLALKMVGMPAWGRRGTTAIALSIGGVCCLLCGCLPSGGDGPPGPAYLVLAFAGKGAVAMAFAVVYLFAAELFPTDLRTSAMGLQSLSARLGGMVAPVVADLGRVWPSLPLFLFGLPSVVAGFLLLSLPETRGLPMPDSIEDMQAPTEGMCLPWFWRRYGRLADDHGEGDGHGNGEETAPEVVGSSQE